MEFARSSKIGRGLAKDGLHACRITDEFAVPCQQNRGRTADERGGLTGALHFFVFIHSHRPDDLFAWCDKIGLQATIPRRSATGKEADSEDVRLATVSRSHSDHRLCIAWIGDADVAKRAFGCIGGCLVTVNAHVPRSGDNDHD